MYLNKNPHFYSSMSYHLYNQELAKFIATDIGKSILRLKSRHDEFWLNLNKKTDYKNFQRFSILFIITMGFFLEWVWFNSFTIIFGNLTPLHFPFGFIKIMVYSFIGYVAGFEMGWKYTRYIDALILSGRTLKINKLIQEIKKPLKKRSISDPNFKAKKKE